MHYKTTLLRIRKFVQQGCMILILFCLFTTSYGQTYVNGNLNTGPTTLSGVAAPAGTTWSEVQNDAGNTTISNGTSGFSGSDTAGLTLADDFTIPAGQSWTINKFTFYAYRTGAPATPSPFEGLRFQIHNGNPSAGPTTIVFGDLTTNRLTASNDSLMYRIFNTISPAPGAPEGTTRKIWSLEATINVTLGAGTYWVEWQTRATGNAVHFAPPSTVVGVRTVAGYNAQQKTIATNVWVSLLDAGNPATAPDVPCDMPFRINYSPSGGCAGTPVPGNTVSSDSSVCPGATFTLSIQNSIPGTGVSFQWQSSPDGVTYTNITGATSNTLSTTLTTATYYQAIVTCSGNPPATSTPVQVTIATSTITTQPNDTASACGGNASFTATASGTSVSYQWQQRITAAAPWTNVVNGLDATTGATFSNATTNTLNIANTGTIMNGYQYRASITGSCAVNLFSDSATLTVNPLIIAVNPSAVNVCTGNTTPVGIAITTVNPSGIIVTDTTAFPSGSTNIFIPDNVPSGIIHSIPVTVPAGATITAASVTLNIIHPWVGDLIIALKAPNGNVLNLDYNLTATFGGPNPSTGFTNTIISSAGVNTLGAGTDPWTGIFAADAPTAPGPIPTAPTSLSPVNANVFTFADLYSIPSGDWTLGIFDAGPADTGTLVNWTLTLTYSYPQGQPYTGVWTPATGLFTDAAATVPYVAGAQEDSVWVLPTANGSYTVTVATGTCTATPVVIPVTVLSAPSITSQPIDVTVCEGANAVFTTTASGTSYQWQVSTDGGVTFTNIAGQTTTTLTLTAVTAAMNNNQYSLLVSSCGPTGINSDTVTLTVNSAASISTQPADTTACVGNDATFSVTGAGTGPLTYQWEVSTDGGATYTPIAGATASTLTVPAVTIADNNNLYHVIISNICSTSLISEAATLTVSSDAVITTQPSATSACAGSNATFSVGATGPGLTYQWQVSTDGGNTFTPIAGQTGSTLTLSAVTDAMNNNQYTAVVTSICSTAGTNSDSALLTVYPKPVITIAASPYTSLATGLSTTITATSIPAATTFTWYLNGAAVSGITGNTITVDYAGLGAYSASVTDANGCSDTSNVINISDSSITNVFVYPNPSTGVFIVTYTDTINGVSGLRNATVYDSKGARVYNQTFVLLTPSENMRVDLSRQPKGVYVLELTDASGIRLRTTRLIKL